MTLPFLNLSEYMFHLNSRVIYFLMNVSICNCMRSFSSSRLSYIGSFKQRIKSTEGATIRKPKVPGSTRVVFLVDMDCFFASVSLKNFPQYRNCPIAIGHTPTVDLKSTQGTHTKLPSPSKTLNNSWSELSTCNYIARKFGVKKGMFLSDAIKVSSIHCQTCLIGA